MNIQLKNDNGKVLCTFHSNKIKIKKTSKDVQILIGESSV